MSFENTRLWKRLFLASLALLLAAAAVLAAVAAGRGGGEAHQQPLPAAGAPGQPARPDQAQPAPSLPPETPAYQPLFPGLSAPGRARSTVYEEKTVYLTFDDGPSERTPEILEILDRCGVKATFFVTGREDEQSRAWMRDTAAAGHTLGLHSYSHDYSAIYASVEAFLEDCDKLNTLVFEAAGVRPEILRFPGGSVNAYNAGIYRELIAEMTRRGYAYFDWNLSAGDAAPDGPDAQTITENALAAGEALNRVILSLHDSAGKAATVEALPAIIEGYQDRGFAFAALTPQVVPVIFGYAEEGE